MENKNIKIHTARDGYYDSLWTSVYSTIFHIIIITTTYLTSTGYKLSNGKYFSEYFDIKIILFTLGPLQLLAIKRSIDAIKDYNTFEGYVDKKRLILYIINLINLFVTLIVITFYAIAIFA